MTRRRTAPAEERKSDDRLADLDPREAAPDQQADIKGGIQLPHGLNLTARPPLDLPSG